jgi:hypothetical protein
LGKIREGNELGIAIEASQKWGFRSVKMDSSHQIPSHQITLVIGNSVDGQEFERMALTSYVWAPDIAEYRSVAERIWSTKGRTELTLYKASCNQAPEEQLLACRALIDLHHGEYSEGGAWTMLTVHGVPLTPSMKELLESDYDAAVSLENSNAFVIRRGSCGGLHVD